VIQRPFDPSRGGGLAARWKAHAIGHYDARAKHYERQVSRGPLAALRRREREAVLRLADFTSPARSTVIDVGCGGGFYSRAAKRAGKWVHAIDAAPAMVELVRRDVDLAEVADLESFAADRAYDVVVCCGVLEFVSSPEVALDRLCHLGAPGGRMVIQVPREGALGRLYRLQRRLEGLSTILYRRERLLTRAEARGLTIAEELHPLPYNMVLAFDATR
jgi:2-polyprenyl-3-methyl-5-hydroxy-6-metoxy-1,4-benzoquinol methylase